MCDCYEHKCEVCGETTSWHIANFAYPRDCFRIWCWKHVGLAPADAVIFISRENGLGGVGEKHYRRSRAICAAIGPDVGDANSPNTCVDYEVQAGALT